MSRLGQFGHDRGTIDDTVVGARTKIDNLCQIGHNVTIGTDCLVAGTAAVGGSVSIGNGVIIGGNVAIADHVTIGDGARVAGRSGITKDIPAGETGRVSRQAYRQLRALAVLERQARADVWITSSEPHQHGRGVKPARSRGGCPAPSHSGHGQRDVGAQRWAHHFFQLGALVSSHPGQRQLQRPCRARHTRCGR